MTFSWTSPRTWVTSEVDTASMFNAQIRDNELALISGARAVATYSAGAIFTVPTSSTIAVPFTSAPTNPSAMWSAGSPTRLTAGIAGWYRFTGRVVGDSPSAYTPKMFKNGIVALTGSSGMSVQLVGEYDIALVVGDYVELCVTAGASGPFSSIPASIGAGDGVFADLVMQWVSP